MKGEAVRAKRWIYDKTPRHVSIQRALIKNTTSPKNLQHEKNARMIKRDIIELEYEVFQMGAIWFRRKYLQLGFPPGKSSHDGLDQTCSAQFKQNQNPLLIQLNLQVNWICWRHLIWRILSDSEWQYELRLVVAASRQQLVVAPGMLTMPLSLATMPMSLPLSTMSFFSGSKTVLLVATLAGVLPRLGIGELTILLLLLLMTSCLPQFLCQSCEHNNFAKYSQSHQFLLNAQRAAAPHRIDWQRKTKGKLWPLFQR